MALLTGLAGARPMLVDTVDVPVEQLLVRYRARVVRYPKEARAHYVLGRLNAIAYAQGEQTQQAQNRKNGEPFFGYFDEGILPRPGESAQHPAERLQEATAEYGKAVELEPNSETYRLGHAWCLEQAGARDKAVEEYRKVFAQAYQRETGGHPGLGPSLGKEAGEALVRLKVPERTEVETKMKQLAAVPRPITPILVPLDRSARFEELVNPQAAVSFDLDGSGQRKRWGWITPKAAWLVYRDRRRHIESGLQMFGSVTFWIFWKDGYQALAALDADGDGLLRGAELRHLELWQDRNQDGISQPAELLPLASRGITALSVRSDRHAGGFPFSPAGVRYRDGSSGPSYDWIPRPDRHGSKAEFR